MQRMRRDIAAQNGHCREQELAVPDENAMSDGAGPDHSGSHDARIGSAPHETNTAETIAALDAAISKLETRLHHSADDMGQRTDAERNELDALRATCRDIKAGLAATRKRLEAALRD